MRPLVILLVSALTVALPRGQVRGEPLPGLLDVEGVVGNEPGLDDVEFEAATARQIPIAADIGELRIPFKLGKAKTLTLTLVWNDGSKTEILFLAADAKYQKKVPGDNFRSVEQRLPGACLEIPALGISYHTRPNPSFYSEAALKGVRAKWASLPNVADHLFLLSIRVEGGGAALSLDGNYVGSIPKTNPLTAVVFPLSEETKVERLLRKKWTPWLPLDIRTLNRPGVMKGAVLSINQDSLNAHDAPIRVANGSLNADVGTVRDVSPPVNMDDSIYRYLERSAFEGLPEALLMSVPSAPYTRAWVLCASEDDPAKETLFQARLTRYRKGGIGNAIVTTPVTVPLNSNDARPDLHHVGQVRYATEGVQKTSPLWLAEVRLNSSEIQDLLYADWTGGRLDFELTGQSRNSKSGVHLFAVTLEQSPVEMEVVQVTPGSVFHNDETPEMKVVLRPLTKTSVVLKWSVENVWSKQVSAGERICQFTQGDEPLSVNVPLKMEHDGWYQVVFSLHNEQGRLLLSHTASYAQLPQDTRRAGYESPFGCWWQQHLHSRMTDPNIIGPLLFKAGIRRTTRTAVSEEVMKPWKVTIDMIPWVMGYRPPGSPVLTPEEWGKEFEGKVREYLVQFPHAGTAMVFHESFGQTWLAPESWWGEASPFTAKDHVSQAKLACKILREKLPHLKIMVGNSGWSGGLISQLLRGGLAPDQIDALGMERLLGYFAKDTLPPERHEASWAMRQIGLKYGCDAPPSDCYESGGRGNYGMSQRLIAEYVVRDSLVGMAWNYPYIGIGTITENVNGYYHTRWGGDAILRRTPLLYPQPQYVAIATMTRVLDRVKLLRQVPTGSHTVYALEFERDKERVYAVWTPRGTCDTVLKFPQDLEVKIDSHYGHSHLEAAKKGELNVTAGEEVTYITSMLAVDEIHSGRRAFPLDLPPAEAKALSSLTDSDEWTFGSTKPVESGPLPYGWLPWRTRGKGSLLPATDPDKGRCLKLELIPEGEVPELLSECFSLQATAPIPVPGTPSTIGVWVKGNSCWGRVMFEILDAEGERFRGGEGVIEPRGTSYINFDGWCFVSLPLSEQSPVARHFLYPPSRLWSGSGGNGLIDYPIRATGLIVELKRKTLDLAEMVSVEPAILLKDLSVYGQSPDVPKASLPANGGKPYTPGTNPQAGIPAPRRADEAQMLLFSDDDLRYVTPGDRPPGFSDGCVLKEENGQRFVSCPQGVTGLFKNLRYYGSHHWQHYEWRFRFRFPARDKVGFNAYVRTGLAASPFNNAPPFGPEERFKWVGLDFSRNGFEPAVVGGIFQMTKGVPWTEKGLQSLESGRWYATVIRVAGRALDVSLEQDGKIIKVYRDPIPAGGGGVGLDSTHPIDVAGISITEIEPSPDDWAYAGRIRIEDSSPIHGAKTTRLDGPFMITDSIALSRLGHPCILSAYIRADKEGMASGMFIGSQTKIIPVTTEWKRYSILALPEPDDRMTNQSSFGLKGSVDGVLWIAAAQVEYAPIEPEAKRAAGWSRTIEQDYELDEKVKHNGNRSLRTMKAGLSMAVQEGEFAREDSRPFQVAGWFRAEGRLTEAKLLVELFRDKKFWIPVTPAEEEPRETIEMAFKTAGPQWEYVSSRINPKNAVKRYRVSVIVESGGGMAWADDLVLRPLGKATAPPGQVGPLVDPFKEETGTGTDALDDAELLGAINEAANVKGNVLKNAGFEEATEGGVVTEESNHPSSYGPTDSPRTWLKSNSGNTR